MYDMGPYYLSAIVNLIGPVKSVAGMTKTSMPTRHITSQPLNGQSFGVDVPTYVTGMMNFQNGAIGTIFVTYDVHAAQLPRIEIYGSEGTLSVPDPNEFCGPVKLFSPRGGGFMEIPLMYDYPKNSRALGLADAAKSIETGRKSRVSSEFTFHILEVMSGILKAGETNSYVEMKSCPERPAPMEKAVWSGILD